MKTFISVFILYIFVFIQPLFAENTDNALRYDLANTPIVKIENEFLNKDIIESILPDDYQAASQVPQGKDPISRLSQSASPETPQKTDLRIKASNAMLDFLFGSLTRHKLTFNIIPDKKEALSVQLHPVKNLTLQFNTSAERTIDTSSAEIKFSPSDNTSISLKTQEENNGTKTGIEFQMAF